MWQKGTHLFRAMLVLSVIVLIAGIIPIQAVQTSAAQQDNSSALNNKVDVKVIETFEQEEFVSVIIVLDKQVDPEKIVEELNNVTPYMIDKQKKKQRAEQVVDTLRQNAAQTQTRLLKQLAQYKQTGAVKDYQSFYIVNAISVTARQEVIQHVAALPEVAEVWLDEKIVFPDQLDFQEIEFSLSGDSPFTVWNIERINAPKVWQTFGVRGEGVVVGIIDTGVDWTHESLKTKWRGYDPKRPDQPNSFGNWFDAVEGRNEPYDLERLPHGTHVLGTVLGEDNENNIHIGVAPGAKWIAARAFTEKGGELSKIWAAGEYMLAPEGRPELAPDIIINSWGGGKDEWFRPMVQAWRAAGIFPVFASGNSEGSAREGSVIEPASYPESFAVGSVDKNNVLSTFSNRGPSPYEGVIKPDVVAPGEAVISAVPGGYAQAEGTSMAAPHVAGVAALMLSWDPSLTVEEMGALLRIHALRLKDETYRHVPNQGYGYGLVDALSTMAAVVEGRGNIQRVYGANRYTTAVQISQQGWDTANTVILARGDDFADGLVAAPLAYHYDAPVLLTPRSRLPLEVENEIRRLGVKRVIILGGTGAVSEEVQGRLETFVPSVERIAGKNRYETAALVAQHITGRADTVFLVSGQRFADTVSVAPYAAMKKWPILLTQKERLPSGTKAALDILETKTVYVIGGNGVIGQEVLGKLPGIVKKSIRVSGPNRYETNVRLMKQFEGQDSIYMFMATGKEFPDVLAGGALAAKHGSGIMLVDETLSETARDVLRQYPLRKVTIFGGEAAVPAGIVKELRVIMETHTAPK